MKILIVSFYFPPFNAIGSLRTGKMAKYLSRLGHEVKVLSVADIPLLGADQAVEIPASHVRRTPWLNVNRPVVWAARKSTVIGKEAYSGSNRLLKWIGKQYKTLVNFPDGQVGWIPFAFKAGERLIRQWRPDLIYASAMPFSSLIIAARLSRRFGIPWVAEFRDLWTQSNYYEFPLWRRWLEGKLEDRTIRSASLLVTVSEPLAEKLRLRHNKPVATILNGFDPEDYALPAGQEEALDQDCLNIVYTGMIYPGKRDPRPLYSALAMLGDAAENIRVHFYGRLLPEVHGLAEEYGIAHLIRVHETVSHQESLALQSQADVLLLLLWNHPSEKGVFSGKLFEYLGARRPILFIGVEDGVAADLIRQRSAGVVANDPQEIAKHLKEWLRTKRTIGAIPALPATVGDGLTRQDQAQRLVEVLQEHLERGQPASPNRRLLFVTPRLHVGGTEQHLLALASRLHRLGYEPELLVLHGGGDLESQVRNSGIRLLSTPTWLPPGARRFLAACRLAYTSIAYPPCCVHAFLPEAVIVAGLVMRLFPGIPFFVSRRCLNHYQAAHPWLARLERRLQLRARRVLGNSHKVLEQLLQEGLPQHQTTLIRNGVDVQRFRCLGQRERQREKLAIKSDALVMVICANLIAYKGHADLLAALAKIKDKLPDGWRLLCAGRDDGEGAHLQRLADKYDLSANIRWLGQWRDIPGLLAASDIGVLPSHQEGFSNSLLEYMAAGLPIVATAVGGNVDAIADGVTGLLVPPRDAAALASAILRLVQDADLRGRLAANAAERVRREFSLERMLQEYDRFYRSELHIDAQAWNACD